MTAARFPIRLLALDIDGTLVGDDLVIHPRTKAAVGAAADRGVAVSLVTGRMATSARPFAESLGLTGPIVAYQGALVRQMAEPGSGRVGRLLYHHPLPAAVAREICAWGEDRGLDIHVNHLEQMILRVDEPHADEYAKFMGRRAVLVPSIREYLRHPVTKLVGVGDEPMPLEAMEAGREVFAGRASVTLSHPRFLEFLAPGISKGRAIRWLARRLGIPLEQTMAIGDQFNDLEMIAEAGHGVAMPSAPPGVLAVARYVAPAVDEEGAAKMIEELILGGRRVEYHEVTRDGADPAADVEARAFSAEVRREAGPRVEAGRAEDPREAGPRAHDPPAAGPRPHDTREAAPRAETSRTDASRTEAPSS